MEEFDPSSRKEDELIECLPSAEIKVNSSEATTNDGVAVKVICEDMEEEELAATMSFLAKKFRKTVRRYEKKLHGAADLPTVHHTQDNSEDYEDITEEEIVANNQMLLKKGPKLSEAYIMEKIERSVLMELVDVEKVKTGDLEAKVEPLTKGITVKNSNTNLLDERSRRTVVYVTIHHHHRRHHHDQKEFVPAQRKKPTYECYWTYCCCGRQGNMTSYCYKLYDRGRSLHAQLRMHRVKNTVSTALLKSFKATTCEESYLDKGCSRDMLESRSNQKDIKGAPIVDELLAVLPTVRFTVRFTLRFTLRFTVRFTVEQMSIQLCNVEVQRGYGKGSCSVPDESKDAVTDQPRMEFNEKSGVVFQMGKQARVSHHMLSQVTTSREQPLKHMDLWAEHHLYK